MQKATRVERFVASLIDSLIMVIIILPLVYIGGGLDSNSSLLSSFIYSIISIIIFMAINWSLLLTKGQTIGKKIMNIKIVKYDGSNIDKDTILKRYGIYFGLGFIPFIGSILSLINVLLIFKADIRCGHDLIADTIVIQV